MAAHPPSRYDGDFVAWPGGCLLIGVGGATIASHAHYAIQFVIGCPDGLKVQFGRNADWQACIAALVPSRSMHSIDVVQCRWSAVIFVEPETAEGKALTARLRGAAELLDPTAMSVAARRLERAWASQKSAEAVKGVCLQIVRELAGTSAPPASDPRVQAAVEYLRDKVDRPVMLEEVASAVHLSPGRFRHLFVEETGMPLRTYVLWRRLLRVWELLMQGASLSAAAHAAGFADSAHLSRTSRAMFGLAPSTMQMTGPLSERMRQARARDPSSPVH